MSRQPAEAFFAPAGAGGDAPLILVHELPKTSVMPLRELIRTNLADHERTTFEGDPRAWYEALSEERRASLRCVAAPAANRLLAPAGRPADVVTVVCDPVARGIGGRVNVQSA